MSRKFETRSIGGLEVRCNQFEVLKIGRLGTRLGKSVLPAYLALASFKMSTDVKELAIVLEQLFSELTEEEFERTVIDLLAGTAVTKTDDKGTQRQFPMLKKEDINAVFEGDFASLMEAVALSIEVNFGPFFERLSAKFGKSPAESPST